MVPPSTQSIWPVIKLASSEARNATAGAISSGLAHLPNGTRASDFSANFGSVSIFSVILVLAAGDIALTVIPRSHPPNSSVFQIKNNSNNQ